MPLQPPGSDPPAPPARPLLVRARRIHLLPGSDQEADALLIRGGRVEAVGVEATRWAKTLDCERLDLGERVITPGLTDSHVHLVEWALSLDGVDLSDTRSPAEAAARVAEHAAAAGGTGWIVGRGWDPHRWGAEPHRRDLDERVGDRPVVLQSHDMHSLWASGAALRVAGIDAGTTAPEGGRIERDADGEPSGVVRENAMPLLLGAAPPPDERRRRRALLEGQRKLHSLGVTALHTVEPDSLALLEAVRAEGLLRLRVLQHLPLAKMDQAIALGLRSGFGGDWIRIGGVKIFLDGALGSRTAWMREPYEGTDRDRGVSTLPPDEFRAVVARGSAAGLAMTVHAIGDAANDLALDVLGGVGAALAGPVPHRIEHVQLLGLDRLGLEAGGAGGGRPHGAFRSVVASVQPSHLMTDWRAADRHWGERSRGAYAFAALERAGATLALGSDAPVEPPDPRQGLYAAVARRDLAGDPAGGWYPEERLSPARALAGYTVGAARAAGDARQGRLTPGAFADLVAWNEDPLAVAAEELLEIEPMITMVAGEVVWQQE